MDLDAVTMVLAAIGAFGALVYFVRLGITITRMLVMLQADHLVIHEIASQFRTNEGSNLRDIVDGLVKAVAEMKITMCELCALIEEVRTGQSRRVEFQQAPRSGSILLRNYSDEGLKIVQELNLNPQATTNIARDAIITGDLVGGAKRGVE